MHAYNESVVLNLTIRHAVFPPSVAVTVITAVGVSMLRHYYIMLLLSYHCGMLYGGHVSLYPLVEVA